MYLSYSLSFSRKKKYFFTQKLKSSMPKSHKNKTNHIKIRINIKKNKQTDFT